MTPGRWSRRSTPRPSPARSSSATPRPARWCGPAGRATPTAPRSTRRPGGRPSRPADRRGRRAGRRRRRRRRRPAARHGLPRRGRARSSAGAAVERHPLRRRRGRPRRGARRRGGRALGRGGRLGAGRVVHRHQAPLAGRARARARRPHGRGVPAARLADLAAAAAPTSPTSPPTGATPAAPATGRADRGLPTDLLERAFGAPAPAARASPVRGRRHARARSSAPARGRQRRRRPGPRGRRGRRGGLDRHLRRGDQRGGHPGRDATGTVAGFADATGHFLPLVCTLNAARVLDAAPDARRRPRGSPPRAVRPPASDGWCWCPTSRASAPPTCPTRPGRCTASPWARHDPGPTSRGRPSRACSAASPTASTRWSPQGVTPPACSWSAAGPPSEAVRTVAAELGVPVDVPPPGSTSPTEPRARPPGPRAGRGRAAGVGARGGHATPPTPPARPGAHAELTPAHLDRPPEGLCRQNP